MRNAKIWIAALGLILTACSSAWAQDPGWPRQLVKPGGTVIIYQPQVDSWSNYTDIKWRQAFQLTPTGGKVVVGAASFEGTTEVNLDTHNVFMFNIQVLNTYFPGQDPATTAQMDQLVRTFVPLTYNASLERTVLKKAKYMHAEPEASDAPQAAVAAPVFAGSPPAAPKVEPREASHPLFAAPEVQRS